MSSEGEPVWGVWSEIVKTPEGPRWQIYGSNAPERKPPKKPPAGGSIERSADGAWLTVYRRVTKRERDAGASLTQTPVAVYMRIG